MRGKAKAAVAGGVVIGVLMVMGQGYSQEVYQPREEVIIIETFYPSPWAQFDSAKAGKMAIGSYEESSPEYVNEQDIKAYGQIKVGRSVIFKPVEETKLNDQFSEYNNGNQEPGELVYTDQDKFYHYNGSSWVPQGSSGGKAIIQTFCPWRNDYREGVVGIGFASNWGMDKNGAGSYPCDPPVCPAGFDNLGIIGSESLSVACSGTYGCGWDYPTPTTPSHPVSSGRVVRACREQ